MHQEPTAIPSQNRQSSTDPGNSADSNHHGLLDPGSPHQGRRDPSVEPEAAGPGSARRRSSVASSGSSRSVSSTSSGRSIDVQRLEQLLPALRGTVQPGGKRMVPGQRVIDYENALLPVTPRQRLGFRVVPQAQSLSSSLHASASAVVYGRSLSHFPNEILANILSHLHPDSLPAVALVSKRFYALVTSPYAWRMAFFRNFPGHNALTRIRGAATSAGTWGDDIGDTLRSETRAFGRLTANATWRSEYLLRTRLLRSLARGKPGRGSKSSGDKGSGVLTYGAKLPWLITHIDASFSNRKKVARALHGAADLGICTASDPTSGKLETWGLEDQFATTQLNEVFPNVEMYGLGDGPAVLPNVMDVSQDYGMVTGEGFPGGRAYFRTGNERVGILLGQSTGAIDPDIPVIPEMLQGVSSVWIAKSTAVPNTTDSMIGIMTGSTLGIITAYSLSWDRSVSWFSNGDMTARWAVCPGVPIISLKVDDGYNFKRKNAGRVWAVAVNALGEVYYLNKAPKSPRTPARGSLLRNAWLSGRSVTWNLIEATRRQPNPDNFVGDLVDAMSSPKSPSDACGLTQAQLEAEAREIEKFFHYQPSHFRRICTGWDMRRKLEVDFGGDDEKGGGEAVFVFDCGHAKGNIQVKRYTRLVAELQDRDDSKGATGGLPIFATLGEGISRSATYPILSRGASSLAGNSVARTNMLIPDRVIPQVLRKASPTVAMSDDWMVVRLKLQNNVSLITASALDSSFLANLTLAEDPLTEDSEAQALAGEMTPRSAKAMVEIPGRRARLLAIGFDNGTVLVWDARAMTAVTELDPLRIIGTESPEISCLAVSALYVVHGGSDGLAQAWDPLASTSSPIKTLAARSSSGRVPRQLVPTGLVGRTSATLAVGAIFLDPNPTVLRGIVAFGPIVRSWSYSSGDNFRPHKHKSRHQRGDVVSRRLNRTVAGHIAAEQREVRRAQKHQERVDTRLRNRFGVGDLNEAEAIHYAQMISEESFLAEEQRRSSPIISRQSSPNAVRVRDNMTTSRPRPAPERFSSPPNPLLVMSLDDDEFEMQLQRAMHLSLLDSDATNAAQVSGSQTRSLRTPSPKSTSQIEPDYDAEFEIQMQRALKLSLADNGMTDVVQSPGSFGSGEYEYAAEYTIKTPKKGKRSPRVTSPSTATTRAESFSGSRGSIGLGIIAEDDFPPLRGGKE